MKNLKAASSVTGRVVHFRSDRREFGSMNETSPDVRRLVRFGVYELDLRSGELRKSGARLSLQQQPLQLLSVLLEQPGQLVTREELRKRLWPDDTFVDFEHGLNAAVKRLRDTLGDSADSPRFIETVPRRGYRFIAPASLDGASSCPSTATEITSEGVLPRVKRGWLLLIAALVISLAALWIYRPKSPDLLKTVPFTTPARRDPRLTKVTFAGDVRAADLSPDGKTVAYASGLDADVRVLVRDLTGDQPHEIWKGTNLWALRWLPNGSELLLGFPNRDGVPNRGIWRLSRFGGATRQVILGPSAYLAVGPDEAEFVHSMEDMVGYQISALDSTGSRSVSLQGFPWLIGLDWNRVTNRVLALSREDNGAYVVRSTTPDGKDVRRHYSDTHRLHAICSSPATGAIYLLRERNDATEILRLTPSTSNEPSTVVLTSVAESVAARGCSVSDRGDRMLYSRRVAHSNIWRFDLQMPTQPAMSLTRGTSLLQVPRVSPDGRIVASQGRGPNSRIVRLPANGGEPFPITSGTIGAISPDGRKLAFVSGRATQYRVWTSDADGLGAAEVQDAVTANPTRIAWLPDGRLAWQAADGMNYRIRDLANGHEELLMRSTLGGYAFDPHFSPNNDQVAIFWIRDRSGLYVLSWPSREPRFIAPNLAPIGWSQDGEWIYALQAVGPFTAQNSTGALLRVSSRTSRVEVIGSFPRGYLTRGSCSLTPDRQAIICALAEEASDAWIIDDFDPDMHSGKQ
jgi:DNA-binding winged helix-turn-helix (wHTH) protein/WD40 repeat protein